ncbi:MAG TPA: hypothetical protein VF765_19650 [Polyangiaceae bacterium]
MDLQIGPFPVVLYAAMLAATIAGQFLGIGVDVLALGRKVLWVPLAISVLLEALVAARLGAARMGEEWTSAQRGRLSAYYSLGLAAVTLPLAVWVAASDGVSLAPTMATRNVVLALVVALAAFAAATLLRWGLMSLFTPRSAS